MFLAISAVAAKSAVDLSARGEVRIMLPPGDLARERERDRQCLHSQASPARAEKMPSGPHVSYWRRTLTQGPCAARILDWVRHLHCCRHDGRSGGWLAGCCSRSSTC